jgi:CheY-like chemotaxis protein
MKKPRILHVEDDPDVREITKFALEAIGGWHVEECSCGEEALTRAAQFRPDLMLVDVELPDMSGPELVLGLRKMPEFMSTPVVYLTAKPGDRLLEKAQSGWNDGIITKPFEVIGLSSYLHEVLSSNEALKKGRRRTYGPEADGRSGQTPGRLRQSA